MSWRKLDTPGDYSSVNTGSEIVVQTNDKQEFVIVRSAISLSKLLNDLLQDVDAEDSSQTTVPLANVDGPTFASVADYLVHFIEPVKPTVLDKPLKAALHELLPEWEKDYVYKKLFKDGNEKEHSLLFATLLAANFLGIEPLRDLCCAAIANMLRAKTPEQIMELFNITEPFTPEEEANVEKQYPWLKADGVDAA
eukprot:EG_transcript_23700